jgi:hypothetical protein
MRLFFNIGKERNPRYSYFSLLGVAGDLFTSWSQHVVRALDQQTLQVDVAPLRDHELRDRDLLTGCVVIAGPR